MRSCAELSGVVRPARPIGHRHLWTRRGAQTRADRPKAKPSQALGRQSGTKDLSPLAVSRPCPPVAGVGEAAVRRRRRTMADMMEDMRQLPGHEKARRSAFNRALAGRTGGWAAETHARQNSLFPSRILSNLQLSFCNPAMRIPPGCWHFASTCHWRSNSTNTGPWSEALVP